MRRSFMQGAIVLVLFTFAPMTRSSGQVALGVGVGPAIPLGDLGDVANTGWRALGTVAIGVPLVPVGLRLDAAYDHFGFQKTPVGSTGSDTGAESVLSATANVTLRLPFSVPLVSTYLIAGTGPYRVSCSGPATCATQTKAGWNAGVGARFGILVVHGFVEARLHHVSVTGGSVQYLPITVGLTL